jgi:uncharacterized protein involved in outer membrane biogenesis
MKTNAAVAKLDHSAAAAVFKVAVSNEEGAFHGYVSSETMEFLYSHLPLLAAEMIQKHLGLASPEFTLSVDKNNKRQLAHYKVGRDGLGLKERISLNVFHLASSKASVISTVLHEMLHGVQYSHGKPGKGNYHNAEFVGYCAKLGIPTNDKGQDLGIDPNGLFADYAKRHNLEGKFELAKKDAPKPKGSNLKKWTCSCGVNVRVAIDDFEATCNKCDTEFVRKD